MSDNQDRTLSTLRTMAWERAKGELRSMAQTYWGDQERFDVFTSESEEFIKHIEDNGIHE